MFTSEQIRMARLGKKWSQTDLKNKAGVGLSTITNMENEDYDHDTIKIKNSKKVLEALGIEI